MKIFKENKILLVVLLASAYDIISMDVPQTPEKISPRLLTQDEHKLFSDQKRIIQSAPKIERTIKRLRDEGVKNFEQKEITTFLKDFNYMKDTPLKTKENLARKVLAATLLIDDI